jgi:APA family basic amino acid/polyamine antiporter
MPATPASSTPSGGLRRALGLREAVAVGVGGTIGGGIFVLVGTAAGAAGPGALGAFALAFVAALLIALPYAELACRYPLAGGGYAFARQVLGRRWGFALGWVFWGAYLFLSGYVTRGFGGYLHELTGLPVVAGALALLAAVTALNLAGVRPTGRAQTAVLGLGVAALLGFALLGAWRIEAANLVPPLPNGLGGVGVAALAAFLAMGGFDMVAAAGEEVDRPERTLPRAILLTLLLVLGLYLLITFVAVGVLPWPALGASGAPLALAATAALGPAGGRLIAGAALLTTAATANAVLVVTSRVSFAMARDGLLPRPLARVAATTGAPWAAVLLSGSLCALVAAAGSVRLAASVGGFLYVLHFVVPLAALAVLRRRRQPRAAFSTPAPALVLPLGLAGCALLLVASGRTGVLGGLGWLLAGLAGYAALSGRSAARPGRTRRRSRPPGSGRATRALCSGSPTRDRDES